MAKADEGISGKPHILHKGFGNPNQFRFQSIGLTGL